MPSESPTRSSGTPASSSSFAIGKSYAVSAAIFSPRAFIARMVSVVIFENSFLSRRCTQISTDIIKAETADRFSNRCFIRVYLRLKLWSNSSGVVVAVPTLPTTMPAA